MKTTITRIGNSKGIIIPASMLKHCGFEDEVSLEIKNYGLVISHIKKPRDGWKEAFIEAGAAEEELLMTDFDNSFDNDEWVWQ